MQQSASNPAATHLLRDVLENGSKRRLLWDVNAGNHGTFIRHVKLHSQRQDATPQNATYTRYGSLGSDVSVTLNVTFPDLSGRASVAAEHRHDLRRELTWQR